MHWRKRNLWKVGITFVGMLLLFTCMVWLAVPAAGAHQKDASATPVTGTTITVQPTPTEDATVTALNKEKLTREVAGQQRTWDNWLWSNAATILSSFLSTLIVVVGALFGFWQWRVGRKDTQNKEAEDRQAAQDKELKDRQDEREKRAEERFQAAVEGLSSERKEAKIGAAILLRTFLRPGYEQFYTQTFDLAVAHLCPTETPHPPEDPEAPLILTTLRQALIMVFKEAFPLARRQNAGSSQSLDASYIQLDNAYLVGADLKQAWMPLASLRKALLSFAQLEGAYLRHAQLEGGQFVSAQLKGANLTVAHLERANFNDAQLEEVYLRGSYLNGAYFRKALLKEAWLERVILTGADLSEANLSGAHLNGATIEDASSLRDTDLRGVIGLKQEQLAACKAKGAIIDEDTTTSASQSTAASPLPVQSNNAQVPSTPPVQGNAPTPDADGDHAPSSKPDSEASR